MTLEDRLSRLVERWRELTARGQAPSATELCSDCPELQDELQRRLDALLPPLGPGGTTTAPRTQPTDELAP